MLDHIEFVKPDEIEARSMAIITRELGTRTWPEPELSIVKRCIHTSADFDYADQLFFSENAGATGIQAIRQGAWIVALRRAIGNHGYSRWQPENSYLLCRYR